MALRNGARHATAALVAIALGACGADDTGTDSNSPLPLAGAGAGGGGLGMAGTGMAAGGAGGGMMSAGRGGAGAGGTGMAAAGTSGSGTGGGHAPAGMGGTTPMVGVDPSAIALEAIPANGTIGLDWSRVTRRDRLQAVLRECGRASRRRAARRSR